ncbi:hypothetical protein NL676_032436 [Syzygium grande]|nr:hypothetical protein NL676_032436 [Syzygium grande]
MWTEGAEEQMIRRGEELEELSPLPLSPRLARPSQSIGGGRADGDKRASASLVTGPFEPVQVETGRICLFSTSPLALELSGWSVLLSAFRRFRSEAFM